MPETPQVVNNDAIKALVALGRASGEERKVGTTPYVVIPNDHKIVGMQDYVYNKYADHPHRKIGTSKVLDAPSFCEYYNLFHDEFSRVFADETTNKLLAVLDYHGTGENSARWGEHRLDLTLRYSKEWQTWTGKSGERQTQMDFAEFVEDNTPDIIDPSGATMLEVARDLSAKTDGDFSSAVRMQNGSVQFKYSEQIKGTFGSGQVEIPERFTVSIPVYVGSERVTLTARLRYRINSGKLTFWYDLLRADAVELAAFLAVRNLINTTLAITIINGSPA